MQEVPACCLCGHTSGIVHWSQAAKCDISLSSPVREDGVGLAQLIVDQIHDIADVLLPVVLHSLMRPHRWIKYATAISDVILRGAIACLRDDILPKESPGDRGRLLLSSYCWCWLGPLRALSRLFQLQVPSGLLTEAEEPVWCSYRKSVLCSMPLSSFSCVDASALESD